MADRLSIILSDPQQRERLEKRFWANVDRSGGPDACWPWTRAIGSHGYGAIQIGTLDESCVKTTHGIALSLTLGRPLDGFACHSCDNRPCCNPSHLFEGTQAENVRDMWEKGRQQDYTKVIRGEANNRCKITEAIARQIKYDPRPRRALMSAFGVSYAIVTQIKTGRTWKHIT